MLLLAFSVDPDDLLSLEDEVDPELDPESLEDEEPLAEVFSFLPASRLSVR